MIVIIESPFRGADGDYQQAQGYLKHVIRECCHDGLTPYASHRMLTDALDDTVPLERDMGIDLGLEMALGVMANISSALVLVYQDRGVSAGMMHAISRYERHGFGDRVMTDLKLKPENFEAYQQELRELRAE